MLKSVMLVSALAISAPVLAQQAPETKLTDQKAEKTAVPSQKSAAETTVDQPIKADLKTDTTASADPVAADTTTEVAAAPTPAGDVSADAAAVAQTTPAPADPAAPAPAQQAAVTGAAQIAQVISTEFPTYDGNKDGHLEKAEFGKWMVALKTASDPSTKATDPATVQWVSGAFAQADTDKSNNVSQAELTKFLTQGAG